MGRKFEEPLEDGTIRIVDIGDTTEPFVDPKMFLLVQRIQRIEERLEKIEKILGVNNNDG